MCPLIRGFTVIDRITDIAHASVIGIIIQQCVHKAYYNYEDKLVKLLHCVILHITNKYIKIR